MVVSVCGENSEVMSYHLDRVCWAVQVYSTNLGAVVDIVVSHQGVATKTQLVSQLMSTLVLPAPEHYRPLLRRLAALGGPPSLLSISLSHGLPYVEDTFSLLCTDLALL